MPQYKAVLIGLGNVAWKMGRDEMSDSSLSHAAAFESNVKTNLIAGYSPVIDEVKQFENEKGVRGYTDLQQMLSEIQPDIVSICSPTDYHAEHLEACLEHCVSMIWLEKPPAQSMDQINRLENRRLQMKKPSAVLVNYQRRYTDSYCRLHDLMNEKSFGEILSVDVKYSRGLETNGSHMLDMIFFLISNQKYNIAWVEMEGSRENPDFILQLDSGLIVHVSGIDAQYHNVDVSVTCEMGRMSILHGGMTLRVEEKREHELFPGYFRLVDVESGVLGVGGFDNALDKALSDLIAAFEEGRIPLSNLSTAYEGQCLLEKIQQRVRK